MWSCTTSSSRQTVLGKCQSRREGNRRLCEASLSNESRYFAMIFIIVVIIL